MVVNKYKLYLTKQLYVPTCVYMSACMCLQEVSIQTSF
jgi:hypothetical protein